MEEITHQKFFVLSFDLIDETQRNLINHQVKTNAASWWHQQSNLWVVQGGDSCKYWRDLLKPLISGVPGNLVVLTLPEYGFRSFAGFQPPADAKWFQEPPFSKKRTT